MWLLEKTLMLGKIEGKRRRGRQRLGSITESMDVNLRKLWETVKPGKAGVLQALGLKRVGQDLTPEQLPQLGNECDSRHHRGWGLGLPATGPPRHPLQ